MEATASELVGGACLEPWLLEELFAKLWSALEA